ncbi:MAG TPA: hypothetical protein VK509_11700, partial [Polyangiales bacterium]|nr:hypothetical protein [Polyangiales bacterium]
FDMTGTEKVQLVLNVALDPDYSDAEVANGPTPATEFPAVISVYDKDRNLIQCQTVCPKVAPWGCKAAGTSCSSDGECCSGDCRFGDCDSPDPAGLDLCSAAEVASNGFVTTSPLAPGTYFVSVKGRRKTEKGFFELQVGDPKNGIKSGVYTPPKWSTVSQAVVDSGAKVLPVLSCGRSWSGNDRCTGAIDQARVLAEDSGAIDPVTKDGLVRFIDPDGSGLGSNLAMSVRDLANHLSMDVTLKPSADLDPNPFQIDIQKCTDKTDPVQLAACKAWTVGCKVTMAAGKETIRECSPGSTPRFVVRIENPIAAPVPQNPGDPFGGYHFSLQLLGNNQALIDEIPVYLIPTDRSTLNPPVPPYVDSGSYEQLIFGKGCAYNAVEGEGDGLAACSDKLDNDSDGLVDNKDPDCFLGTCLDGKDNDMDGLVDNFDGSCEVTAQQEWTDLFFNADLPFGTSIDLEACTAPSKAELNGCSYAPIATVRSLIKSCSTHDDCAAIDLGSGPVDGYCSSGGQCQHIDPQKLARDCDDDSDCENGTFNGKVIASSCDLGARKCRYASQPADLGGALPDKQRSLPYLQLKITLNASSAGDAAPTLFDWSAQYLCRSSR